MKNNSVFSLAGLLRLILVALVTALFAHSIAVVGKLDPAPLVLGGAGIGLVAYALSRLVRPLARAVEESHPPRTFLGVRIATIGLMLAAAGWLVTVYLFPKIGVALVLAGIVMGLVGIVISFAAK